MQGAYTRDVTISLAIMPPPLPLSGHEVIVGRGWEPSAERCRALPSASRRDGHDASGRLKSFSVEEQGSRALLQSSWRVHRWSVFTVDTSTVDSRGA